MSIDSARIQLRRGTSEALAAENEVLFAGEMCIETDTGKFKLGDGVSTWNELEYSGGAMNHETWEMTLDDDTELSKEVVIWTSQD